MTVLPINDEFTRGLPFLIDDIFFNTQLLFVEKASTWIDAYYTLFGPLLIVLIMALSDKIKLRGGVIGVSILVPITYFAFSQVLQHTSIHEYLFDKSTKILTIQKVYLDHDKTTPRKIMRTIAFKDITTLQYLKCPTKPHTGYELNLILTSGERVNLFSSTDATLLFNVEAIHIITDISISTPECQL